MLTYAARMPDDVAANITAAQADPFLQKYVADWGQPGDRGVLAVDESGTAVGAAWVRLLDHNFHARNHAAENIPELVLGVRPALRGQGIGTALMARLITEVTGHYPALVLSVRAINPAVHLYERLGFVTVEEIANRVGTASLVMELDLTADE
jgi:ribosomal protein S18 acetylase RimI-like enzyme